MHSIAVFIKLLTKKERIAASLVLGLILLSIGGIFLMRYLTPKKILPANGGTYKEAMVGYPQYLNPVLSYSNDVDRDLVKLVFSGLMKVDADGNLVPDLAQSFTVDDAGKVYTFHLRKNISWNDGKPFNADDVIFTIKLIQNPLYNSPLRFNWEGVRVEKIDNLTIKFVLKSPYAPFLANTTLGILPQHIWQAVAANQFKNNAHNYYPIGTGPFVVKKLNFTTDKISKQKKISIISLERNPHAYFKKPYLSRVIIKFYPNEDDALKALNKGWVDGLALSSSFAINHIHNLDKRFNIFHPSLPRYFAAFFNQKKQPLLANKNLRLALAYATDKVSMIKQIFHGEALKIDGPIPAYLFNQKQQTTSPNKTNSYEYNLAKAKEFLDKVPKKNQIYLTITVPTIPELQETARLLQKDWNALGVKVKISPIEADKFINSVIRPRNYEILIFGQVLGLNPDPFSFWHSSQIRDPGLNLCFYQNKKVDMDLEKARQEINPQKRLALYQDFQSQLTRDVPAIFLYSPYYLYIVRKKIKGIKTNRINLPSDRFTLIEDWYIKTKSVNIQ